MAQLPYTAFTNDYHRVAESEGWWLSIRSDGYVEIQKYDDSAVFANDALAYEHVSRKARDGSYLHQLALHLAGTKQRR